VQVAGAEAGTIEDLYKALEGLQPGATLEVALVRGTEERTATLTLAAPPEGSEAGGPGRRRAGSDRPERGGPPKLGAQRAHARERRLTSGVQGLTRSRRHEGPAGGGRARAWGGDATRSKSHR
ncbi:MAG: hypothetical protein QOD62_2067, partial [Actinomycetota bacterium]|nr:hypothetical protein [Actinomycetota bacterium]